MAVPKIINDFYQGRTVIIPMVYKVNAVATDITGYTFTFMMKKRLSFEDADKVLEKNAVITDAANGLLTLTLTATETDIKPKKYYYDFISIDASGDTYTIDQNTVEILTPVNLP